LPLVVLVDTAHEDVALLALAHGASDYLLKEAITPARLALTIHRVVVADTAYRQRAEAALRASEERFRLFAEHARDIIFRYRIRPIPAIEYISPAAERMTGYPREAFYTDPQLPIRVLGLNGISDVKDLLPKAMPSERPLVRWQHKDGTIGWAEVGHWPVIDESGQIVAFEGIVRDVTSRVHIEAALQAHADALSQANADLTRALHLKDDFLAMMSHELRTPLTVILGVTEALDNDLYGPIDDQQRAALAMVTQSGRHLLAILSDILDLAHIEASQISLDRHLIDVDLLCRTSLQYVQAAAQQKKVHLEYAIDMQIDGLRADERRLTQILVNLLDNAVKFTPVDGRVGLEVLADSVLERIQFTVWDTGIGIAAADQPRLFQPFTQLDGRLSRQYGGVGLGLTLVLRLVNLHGGGIIVESAPGQGSRFIISLPWTLMDNTLPSVVHLPQSSPQVWVQPPRVLIADDHEPTLRFYTDLLTQQGCSVATARSGEEVLAQAWARTPDVVVMDIQMPGVDGLEAIRRIRTTAELAAIPIIALTALAMPGDRERCLVAGANVYLAKPVGVRTLLAAIADQIDH
ncbi:MAG: response regulator, partial [Oscillochloris sp.]|nr:response regulator [Oscillochloris sp.]